MKLRKTAVIIGLATILAVLAPCTRAIAGAGPEPPATATILGDEVWGFVALICYANPDLSDYAVVRVKRIVDCDVNVEVHTDTAWAAGCPVLGGPVSPEETLEDWSLLGQQFFGINGTPYIERVKNFTQITDAAGNTVSTFDAKFKFYQ